MAKHISVFMENKPGQLEKITKILAENNINLRAITVANSGDYGIVKVLVNNPSYAYEKLKANNVTVSQRDILAVVVPDSPGGLLELIKTFSENKINIEDCYGFVLAAKKQAVIIVEVGDLPSVETTLKDNAVVYLSDKEIYNF